MVATNDDSHANVIIEDSTLFNIYEKGQYYCNATGKAINSKNCTISRCDISGFSDGDGQFIIVKDNKDIKGNKIKF